MKDFLHHLFVPRKSNKFRSKLLHFEVILLIIAFLISGSITMAGVQREYPAVLGISSNVSISDLLYYTNLKRQANGLSPLKLNDKLTKAAENKAKNMFGENYWAHVAPDGTTPWVFIKDAGYEYLYAGENLARGYTTGEDVVNAWMASPSHRENLLSPNYTDIGFAIATGQLTGSDTVLVVQMFGSPYSPKDGEASQKISDVPAVATPQNGTLVPSGSLSPTPAVAAQASTNEPPQNTVGVASIQNQPLLDSNTLKRNLSFFFLGLFIVVLLIDAFVVERKKIARAVAHNLDHVFFLLFILIAGIIIGSGVIM